MHGKECGVDMKKLLKMEKKEHRAYKKMKGYKKM